MAHIVLAEDESNIYKLIHFRLQHLGHTITWAADGAQALDAIRAQLPDLILLDVMMPIMDGFHVLRHLKADATTRQIPVIMLTARGHENDIVTGISGGAEDYVVKPFNFPELVTRVNAALARRERAAHRPKA